MLPYLNIGPLLIQMPAVALMVGIWFGMNLAERAGRRLKLPADGVTNLIFSGLIAGLGIARLAHASQYLSLYLAEPFSLFSLNPGALDPTSGLLGGLAAASFYAWRKKLPLRPTLDALAPGLAAFLVSVGIAHFFSGDAYGAPTELPWSIYLWNENRHPSQVYETLAALLVLGVSLRRKRGEAGSGMSFLLVVALSAAARLFLEAFRGDSLTLLDGFRQAQAVSLGILLLTLWMMRRLSLRLPAPEYPH